MNVKITVAQGHDLDKVSAQLEDSGIRVRQKLPALGILLADVNEDSINKARTTDGVHAVSPDRENFAS